MSIMEGTQTMEGAADSVLGLPGAAPRLSPPCLAALAQGFSRAFWGLALMVVLFLIQSELELFRGVRIPAYIAGAALLGWGLMTLRTADIPHPAWRAQAGAAARLAFLTIYLAPFIAWWRLLPQDAFLTLNVLALLLACMLLLWLLNRLAAGLFEVFGLQSDRLEAGFFGWTVAALMLAPFALAVTAAGLASLRREATFAQAVWMLVTRTPIWMFVAATLPCSLSLVALWKAKALCSRRLRPPSETGGCS